MLALTTLISAVCLTQVMADSAANGVEISNEDPLIFYHGRWDRAPGTWWYVTVSSFGRCLCPKADLFLIILRASSGLKLNIDGLQSLTLRLGENTTSPSVPVGFSLDYEPFVTVNISTGSNSIPLKDISSTKRSEKSSVLRITSQGWQDNRMNLESIVLNSVHIMFQCSLMAMLLILGRREREPNSYHTLRLSSRFRSLGTRYPLCVSYRKMITVL